MFKQSASRLLCCLLALAGSGAAGAAPWPAAPPLLLPDAESTMQLRAGEVLVLSTAVGESTGSARVQALFKVAAPALWSVLGDCQANFDFVHGLRECEVLTESEKRATTRQRVKRGLFWRSLDYSFETVREPHAWIRIRLLEGDLKELEGSWRFDPVPTGEALLVTHEIRLRPRLPAPAWLVERTVRRDVADMVACLRWHSGGSPDSEVARQDRQRCPD